MTRDESEKWVHLSTSQVAVQNKQKYNDRCLPLSDRWSTIESGSSCNSSRLQDLSTTYRPDNYARRALSRSLSTSLGVGSLVVLTRTTPSQKYGSNQKVEHEQERGAAQFGGVSGTRLRDINQWVDDVV